MNRTTLGSLLSTSVPAVAQRMLRLNAARLDHTGPSLGACGARRLKHGVQRGADPLTLLCLLASLGMILRSATWRSH